MNWRRATAVTGKDIKEVLSTGQIIWPMMLVPLLFIAVAPSAIILGFRSSNSNTEVAEIIDRLPQTIAQQLYAFDDAQKAIYFTTVYLFASFFLIIPIMVSVIISANSFAGEKERKTLEGVLYTPITDTELILGKIMSPFMPAMTVSWTCFLLYSVVVNILAYPVFKSIYFPTTNWWIMMVWLVPLASFLAIGLVVSPTVVKSTKVTVENSPL